MAAVALTYFIPYKGIARQHEPCKDFHFMEQEIWKDIVGYEGCYQVSDKGRVRSVDRIAHNRYGTFLRKGQIVKSYTGVYECITLCVDGVKYLTGVHRVMARAFIPNPENKPQVNHINGIKTDNRLDNFEWVDRAENQEHAYSIGLQKPKKGADNVCSKPVQMCSMSGVVLKEYTSLMEAAKENNLRQGSISNVLIGNSKSLHGLIFKYA